MDQLQFTTTQQPHLLGWSSMNHSTVKVPASVQLIIAIRATFYFTNRVKSAAVNFIPALLHFLTSAELRETVGRSDYITY